MLKRKRRKQFIIITSFIILLGFLIIRIFFDYGMYIGKHRITQEEYLFYQKESMAEVSSDMYSQYSINLSGDLKTWEQDYGDIRPMDYLEQMIVEKLVHDYSVREIAADYKIEVPMNWEEAVKSWGLFHQQKQAQVSSGDILYGPEQFEFLTWYSYQFKDMENSIVTEIGNELREREEEVKSWYESMPPEEIVRHGSITMDRYTANNPDLYEKGGALLDELGDSYSLSGARQLEDMGFSRQTEIIHTRIVSKEDSRTASAIQFALGGTGRYRIIHDGEQSVLEVVSEVKREEVPAYEENSSWAIMQYAYKVYQNELNQKIQSMKVTGSVGAH